MAESGSIPICTYYDNEEIFEKIKKSFGYYTYTVAGNWLAICLDETGEVVLERKGQPDLPKKNFIVKWGEVSLTAVKQ